MDIGPRIQREIRTIETMIGISCHDRHHTDEGVLCDECRILLAYAAARLRKCPFQEGKTTCAKCPVHCYKKDMREKMRAVMRYAGPKMLFRHPLMALRHMFDGLRKAPVSKVEPPEY